MRGIRTWATVVVLVLAVATIPGCKGRKGPHPGLQPKRVVAWAPVSKPVAVGEGLQLDAYIDYGSSKGSVTSDIRAQDRRDIKWRVVQGGGTVNKDTWVFAATQPGSYDVFAEYGPLSSKTFKVRVRSKYAGTYRGTLTLPPAEGVRWGLATIGFTVDDLGVVAGEYNVRFNISGSSGSASAFGTLMISGVIKGTVVDGNLEGTARSSFSGGVMGGSQGSVLNVPLSASADGRIKAVLREGAFQAFEGTVDGIPFTAHLFTSE
jgi:hypothetical protein